VFDERDKNEMLATILFDPLDWTDMLLTVTMMDDMYKSSSVCLWDHESKDSPVTMYMRLNGQVRVWVLKLVHRYSLNQWKWMRHWLNDGVCDEAKVLVHEFGRRRKDISNYVEDLPPASRTHRVHHRQCSQRWREISEIRTRMMWMVLVFPTDRCKSVQAAGAWRYSDHGIDRSPEICTQGVRVAVPLVSVEIDDRDCVA
jgi:hypothetical protein